MAKQKQQIAILGGGMASLTTALRLTELPDWKSQYEITLYQQGGRLGGKGASSRNRAAGDRNEEHGLHMLFGFYENVWRILRDAYEEAAEPLGGKQIDDVWKPLDRIVMYERVKEGDETRWESWHAPLYKDESTRPGDGEAMKFDPWLLLARGSINLLMWALEQMRRGFPGFEEPKDGGTDGAESLAAWQALTSDPALAAEIVRRWAQRDESLAPQLEELVAALVALSDALVPLAARKENLEPGRDTGIRDLIAAFVLPAALIVRGLLAFALEGRRWTFLRRGLLQLDFALTTVYGLLRENLFDVTRPDLFGLDEGDYREWLERWGAHRRTLDAPMVQGLYAGAFHSESRVGAGTQLNAWLRGAFFKGWPMYKFTAGMGEQVFAPLYLVLKARGVRFRFFHRVEKLELSSDRRSVARITIEPQLGTGFRPDGYDPLEQVGEWKCWRRHPDPMLVPRRAGTREQPPDFENWWDPWDSGERITLEAGKDFHEVVLGISIGAFPYICEDLIADRTNPQFADMVASVVSVQTQGLQLWLRERRLNEEFTGDRKSPVVIPFALPFDTWCDMSHLRDVEKLPGVKSIGYLCGPLPDERPPPPRRDETYVEEQRQRVRDNAQQWIRDRATELWPRTRLLSPAGKGSFDWSLLVPGTPGAAPNVESQFFTATTHPSDRYVLAVPFSHQKRLRADGSGYENLVLAGDWTRNPLSIGCLEGAAMSGILAARAIDPRVERPIYDFEEDDVAAPARPNYVLRDGEMLVIPPIGLDAKLAVFPLLANRARLQRLVDLRLNLDERQPGRFSVPGLGPHSAVFLYCADMNNLVAAGSMREHDFGFWVPVRGDGENFLFTPYLWVDSSAALVGGRTVFGFQKHIAALSMPETLDETSRFTLETPVNPTQGGAAVHARLLDVVPVSQPLPNPPAASVASTAGRLDWLPRRLPPGARQLLDELAPFVPEVEPDAGLKDHLPRSIFLKEFPEIQGYEACYQAVTAGRIRLDHVVDWGLLGRSHRVRILECFSHHIVQELGLSTHHREPGTGRLVRDVIDPLFGYWLHWRGVVEPGAVIARSGAGSG